MRFCFWKRPGKYCRKQFLQDTERCNLMEDGSIVHGTEPEFEECETVADSFEDFMEKVVSGRIRL